jgi:hypothetical protein
MESDSHDYAFLRFHTQAQEVPLTQRRKLQIAGQKKFEKISFPTPTPFLPSAYLQSRNHLHQRQSHLSSLDGKTPYSLGLLNGRVQRSMAQYGLMYHP